MIILDNTKNKKYFSSESAADTKVHRLQVLQENSIFSYQVKKEFFVTILSQIETDFSLSIKMEPRECGLQVTKFTLNHHVNVAALSPELNDVAVLEMLLQALMIVFIEAQQYQPTEILFILSKEDVNYLSIIEGFFDDVSSDKGSVFFTVYNTLETREFLAKKVSIIKIKLEQELWKAQRIDPYLKNYLQHHQKGTLLPGSQAISQNWDNVLTFPSIH
jgi:hypothetical protein